MRILWLTLCAACAVACRASEEPQWQDRLQTIATELIPGVERAVGLTFKYPPNVAVRTRDEVHQFLIDKLASELPPDEIERTMLAYRIFGLIPETLDLGKLLLDLYTEQIVGFYDPRTDSLYVVSGQDEFQVRMIVAHELAHALQAQYVPLDSILGTRGDNDRQLAAQAVMEGQGVIAMLALLLPDQAPNELPDFWQEYRQMMRDEQERMPIFSTAPLLLKEILIFPYLGGADFVRWFERTYPDTVPYGRRLPQSTEHILEPNSYREGDEPVTLRFRSSDGLVHDDGLGQFEIRVLVTVAAGSESIGVAAATGWGGDRYGVFEVGESHALVWWTVWDSPLDQRRFASILEREWAGLVGAGRQREIVRTELGDHPAVLVLDAPEGWHGMENPPAVDVIPRRR